MLAQPPVWFIAIAFICAIGPLVFFHELGHYLVARWCGVGAEQFSIGFGREILGWTDKRGTRWKVGWLPLGGYVRFVGDMNAASQPDANPDLPVEKQDVAFHNKSVWKRFLIVLAGPMANFLLAIFIFAAFFMAFGKPNTPPMPSAIAPNSAAAAAGLKAGDRISSIAGQSTLSFEDIYRIVAIRAGETVQIDLVRDGSPKTIEAKIGSETVTDEFGQKYVKGLLGLAPPKR